MRYQHRFGLIAVFIAIPAAALDAPTLISAVAAGPDEVRLTWRNNSSDTRGFIVLRKKEGESGFAFRDTVTDLSGNHSDTRAEPESRYQYAVLAYDGSGIESDTSNRLQVETPAAELAIGEFSAEVTEEGWVRLRFLDPSRHEKGYRIQRALDQDAFASVKEIISDTPAQTGTRTWVDERPASNDWNHYRIEAFAGTRTVQSAVLSRFPFDPQRLRVPAMELTLDGQLGSLPITFPSWAIRSGDTVLLRESNAPDSVCSRILVPDSAPPKFLGYSPVPLPLAEQSGFSLGHAACGGYRSFECFAYSREGFVPHATLPRPESVDLGALLWDEVFEDSFYVSEWDAKLIYPITSFLGYSFPSSGETRDGLGGFMQPRYARGADIHGFLDGRLYAKIYFSESNAGGPLDSVLKVIDFRPRRAEGQARPLVQEYRRYPGVFRLPKTFSGYALTDPLLLTARKIFMDSSRRQVILLDNSQLRVFKYALRPFEKTVGIRASKGRSEAGARAFSILRSGTGWFVPDEGKAARRLEIFRADGTKSGIPVRRVKGGWTWEAPSARGVHIIRLETPHGWRYHAWVSPLGR